MQAETQTIVEAIDRLTSATSYSWVSYILAMFLNLLPVIASALAAYYFTRRHWEKVKSIDLVSRKALALCSVIDEIENTSLSYWAAGAIQDENTEQLIAEIKIKSRIPLSIKLVSEFLSESMVCKDVSTIAKLNTYQDRIFELVTGDDFEVSNRLADPRKAMKIAKLCTETKTRIARYCQ